MSMPKTLLITGASSGFGRALFHAGLKAGHTVVGAVRGEKDRDALEALSSDGRSQAVILDVTDFSAIGVKAAAVIMDLVTLDEPPVHLLLGSDALGLVKPALRTALDEIDIWEKVSRSTDFRHSSSSGEAACISL